LVALTIARYRSISMTKTKGPRRKIPILHIGPNNNLTKFEEPSAYKAMHEETKGPFESKL